jgi:hypothetical protein
LLPWTWSICLLNAPPPKDPTIKTYFPCC